MSSDPSPQVRAQVVECVILAVACLITYELVRGVLSRVYSVSHDDDLVGGMWAVIATIFVFRDSFAKSIAAAVSRMAATSVSFVLCLIYLAFLPFHAWALAVLVAVSPHDAWQQPILRLVDTIIGVAVGAAAAWASTRIRGRLSSASSARR